MHFPEWIVLYFDSNFTEVVPRGQIDNMPALVQVMAWRQIGELGVDEIMRLSPVRREAIIWPMLTFCQLDYGEHISMKF